MISEQDFTISDSLYHRNSVFCSGRVTVIAEILFIDNKVFSVEGLFILSN